MLGINHILVSTEMIFAFGIDSFFLPVFADLNSYTIFYDLMTMTDDFDYNYER